MSDFATNFGTYNIVSENELAIVLSHYSSDYVYDIVMDAINKRFNNVSFLPVPNIVHVLENNFKSLKNIYNYTDAINEIDTFKYKTYIEIINIIRNHFNIDTDIQEDTDILLAAGILYDFFVSGFSTYLCNFFGDFIYRERNSIYDNMGLADLRKNKDSSTAYGKKIYKDLKLAIINANIDLVVHNMEAFDIRIEDIFNTVYPDKTFASFISSITLDMGDFYKDAYVAIMGSSLRPVLISNIRFRLQERGRSSESFNIDQAIKPEE